MHYAYWIGEIHSFWGRKSLTRKFQIVEWSNDAHQFELRREKRFVFVGIRWNITIFGKFVRKETCSIGKNRTYSGNIVKRPKSGRWLPNIDYFFSGNKVYKVVNKKWTLTIEELCGKNKKETTNFYSNPRNR